MIWNYNLLKIEFLIKIELNTDLNTNYILSIKTEKCHVD